MSRCWHWLDRRNYFAGYLPTERSTPFVPCVPFPIMTGFTKILAAINLVGALASIAMFAATCFAEGFILEKAKDYALDATRSRLEPVITFLENPKLPVKLPPSVEERLAKELADYREDPEKWLAEIAEGSDGRAANFEFPEVRNPIARKGLDFLDRKISGASEHFRKSYENLILDLRIFTGTNACAFLLATGLLCVARTKQMRHWLGAWSVALLVATLGCIWFYVGQDWTSNLVFNRHLGWAYASLHALTVIFLFHKMEPVLVRNQPVDGD